MLCPASHSSILESHDAHIYGTPAKLLRAAPLSPRNSSGRLEALFSTKHQALDFGHDWENHGKNTHTHLEAVKLQHV